MSSTTPCTTPSMISRFEADNADLAPLAGATLSAFAGEPTRHARFLNTLSLLEHMGCRKIMATQSGPDVDRSTLRHLAEEARHALFFKRQAEKAAAARLDYSNASLAAPATARMYLQRLDAFAARTLGRHGDRRVPYLYVSLAVELRALWLYRIYQPVIERAKLALSLGSVLAEEGSHLDEMARRLQALGRLDATWVEQLCARERTLFMRLLAALGRDAAAFSPPGCSERTKDSAHS